MPADLPDGAPAAALVQQQHGRARVVRGARHAAARHHLAHRGRCAGV